MSATALPLPACPALLLRGEVMHERLKPAHHAFRYPLFQIACDVAQLDALNSRWFGVDRRRPLSVRTRDYGPCDGTSLDAWMRGRLADAGLPADGPIWLQTIPRMLGYAFNPVSFWYCHDRDGALCALYADVRNTFGQRHGYLLCAPGGGPIGDGTPLVCRKTFHVSPFCDIEGDYVFRVQRTGDAWTVAIDYRVGGELRLRTAIAMQAEPFDGPRVWRAVLAQPFNAVAVMLRIHWQALRLLRKNVPFYGKTPPAGTLPAARSTLQAGTPSGGVAAPDREIDS